MCKEVFSDTEKSKASSVHAMLDLAESICGVDFKTLFLNGPKSVLDSTLYCQPAVVIASLVALETFKERMGNKVGHVNTLHTFMANYLYMKQQQCARLCQQ